MSKTQTGDEPARRMRCTCNELGDRLGCVVCEVEVPAQIRGRIEADFREIVNRIASE